MSESLYFMLVEWMGVVDRILVRLCFSLGSDHLLCNEDRAYLKKMCKESSRIRYEFRKEGWKDEGKA